LAAYYNEIDQFAAEWLRQLIKHGHIAPGDVDTRSIEDVTPTDLRGYTQCHFFAGVGVWSYALRLAGWPDDKPVWTGSCPCQPFSTAGKGAGFDDERHLWPSFYWLIEQCQPPVVFGEQVASKDAEPWIDLVQLDLEAMDYAFGCVPFPSAGIGAPHIRDRAYWVADTSSGGRQHEPHWSGQRAEIRGEPSGAQKQMQQPSTNGTSTSKLADSECQQRKECVSGRGESNSKKGSREAEQLAGLCGISGMAYNELQQRPLTAGSSNDAAGRQQEPAEVAGFCSNSGMADAASEGQSYGGAGTTQPKPSSIDGNDCLPKRPTSPTNGFWRDVDWLLCRDAKWRPVEPGTFPLVNGSANRVGRLRGYGNAINAEAAKTFIEAFLMHRDTPCNKTMTGKSSGR
jgi:DNA (cytosine-5)-methyltransferase 1